MIADDGLNPVAMDPPKVGMLINHAVPLGIERRDRETRGIAGRLLTTWSQAHPRAPLSVLVAAYRAIQLRLDLDRLPLEDAAAVRAILAPADVVERRAGMLANGNPHG